MCVYLYFKFQVSCLNLISFRQGVILHPRPPFTHTHTHRERTPKRPAQISVKLPFFFKTIKIIMHVSENNNFPLTKHIHSPVSHLLKKWDSSSLQWALASKLKKMIQDCCTIARRTDKCWWNVQVFIKAINCIYIHWGFEC